ncbi:MAG TPA: hypothetical protein VIL48_14200 [Acidimicrobiales bacterium]
MAKVKQGKVSRIERGLQFLQRNGVRKGVLGGSRGWFWVAVGTYGVRRLRRAIGSEPELVFRGELKPGETFQIGHLAETYGGKKLRRRART